MRESAEKRGEGKEIFVLSLHFAPLFLDIPDFSYYNIRLLKCSNYGMNRGVFPATKTGKDSIHHGKRI